MNVRLVVLLFPLLSIGASVHAQSTCSDCFNAAQAEARKCLDNAISTGDRNDCLETRQTRTKACSDNQCREDREEVATTESQPTHSLMRCNVMPSVSPRAPLVPQPSYLLKRSAG